jgi:hypothetical protein
MSNGPAFFQTRMGVRHYEHTMPELVRQLTRLNDLIERFVHEVELDRVQADLPIPTAAGPASGGGNE